MSNWTHAQCAKCWVAEWGETREPVVISADWRELERCCWCGNDTIDGIFVRADPANLGHCEGHDDD